MARRRSARKSPRVVRGRLSLEASEVLAEIRARGAIALLFTRDGKQCIKLQDFGRRRNAKQLRERIQEHWDEIVELLRLGCSESEGAAGGKPAT